VKIDEGAAVLSASFISGCKDEREKDGLDAGAAVP
jgi:hypothetical protein